MRRYNQSYEGFDPFQCEPDEATKEMITAFSNMAERQIEIEERRQLRRACPNKFEIPLPE